LRAWQAQGTGGFAMYLHVHFAAVAAWLLLAIAGLIWVMACALAATKMEKEGITFWKGFLVGMLLSPLAGLIVIFIARMVRPERPLAHDVGRG
jgi:fructose-specific phosphotransferase system IIC component